MVGTVKVERVDPVTGEITVTHESLQQFVGRTSYPDYDVQNSYMNQYGKSISEGKTPAQAKADALEVAKKITLAQIKGESVEVKSAKKQISETWILWLLIKTVSFWIFSFVISLCLLGVCAGLVWKCFRWAMSL